LDAREVQVPILPRDVKKALELLKADPARARTIDGLAAECGVARRTLEKHFRRFLGRTPSETVCELRLDRVRRELLRARPETKVGDIAVRAGITHLGRLAAAYEKRYGEKPSATLQRRRQTLVCREVAPRVPAPTVERPVIAVHPFEPIGTQAHSAATIADEICVALLRNRWLALGSPAYARYHLRGKVRAYEAHHLRILVMLTDAPTGRHLWADRWDGEAEHVLAFEERVATRVALTVERLVRAMEVERASRKDAAQLGAWDLTMRAVPRAFVMSAASQAEALELLGRAMELAPQDPLPQALAAWCHAQRGTHHFASQPAAEKEAGRDLALRAARLSAGDPYTEALLGATHTLAHDFEAAGVHIDRALALDGGCALAWTRSGLLNAYRGRSADAVECFQIARSLSPDDPLNFFCSIGMACAHFDVGRYDESARWWTRVLAEHPPAVWANRFRAPAYALAGRKEEAYQSFADLMRAYPGLTIGQVQSALPHTASYSDRVSEALASLGMQP
jgi:TolB-like protein